MAKNCIMCGQNKEDNDFYTNPNGWTESVCKLCRSQKHSDRYKKLIADGKCRQCGQDRDDLSKVYCSSCREMYSVWLKADRKKRPEFYRSKERSNNQKIRITVFEHYGRICDCCGENSIELLAIDHIGGGGNKHRKANNLSSGTRFYRWLINNHFPVGFRTLCHNCNFSLGAHGYCPHEKGNINLIDLCIRG